MMDGTGTFCRRGSRKWIKKLAMSAVVMTTFCFAVPAADAGLKVDIGENSWIAAGLRLQFWYQGVFEENDSDIHDFMLRRPYLHISGQIIPKVTFFTHIAGDRIGQHGLDKPGYGLGTGIAVRDAWITIDLLEELKVQVGRMYIPFTRAFGTESTFALCTLDLPFVQGGVRGAPFFPSKVGRDDGVVLWGNILDGMVQYRFMASEGQEGDKNPEDRLRLAGRLSVSLLDPEVQWFNKGTYLGTKKVLSLGAGLDTQNDLQWAATGPSEDYQAWTVDLFFDYPIGSGSITVEGAYVDMENAPGDTDATTWYVLSGFTIPRFVDFVQVQPYFRFERFDREDSYYTNYVCGGLNFFVNGHAFKAVLDFTRAMHKSGAPEQDSSLFTTQLQVNL